MLEQEERLVVVAAGSRGVTSLKTLRDSEIQYAVDINPRKQGKYVPGTGQLVVPPEFLQEYNPDRIVIVNPIYKRSVEGQA